MPAVHTPATICKVTPAESVKSLRPNLQIPSSSSYIVLVPRVPAEHTPAKRVDFVKSLRPAKIVHCKATPAVPTLYFSRKVDVRLPGKGNSNSRGARPVHRIIPMIKWIQTSRLSIQNFLSVPKVPAAYTPAKFIRNWIERLLFVRTFGLDPIPP